MKIQWLYLEEYKAPVWMDSLKLSLRHGDRVASTTLSILDSKHRDKEINIEGSNELVSIVTYLSYYCECQAKDTCFISSNSQCTELNTGTLSITATSERNASKSTLLSQTQVNLHEFVLVSLANRAFHCISFSPGLHNYHCTGQVDTIVTAKSLDSIKLVPIESLVSSISSLTPNTPNCIRNELTENCNMFMSPESSWMEDTPIKECATIERSRTNLAISFQAITESNSKNNLLDSAQPPSIVQQQMGISEPGPSTSGAQSNITPCATPQHGGSSLSDSQSIRLAAILTEKLDMYERLFNDLKSRLDYHENVHISKAAEQEIIKLHTVIEQQMGFIDHMGCMFRKYSRICPMNKHFAPEPMQSDELSPLISTIQNPNPWISERYLELYVKELLQDDSENSPSIGSAPCTNSHCVTIRALGDLERQRLKFALINLWNVHVEHKEKHAQLNRKNTNPIDDTHQTRMHSVRRYMQEPHELNEVISELITTKLKCAQLGELTEKQFLQITSLNALVDNLKRNISPKQHKQHSLFSSLFKAKKSPSLDDKTVLTTNSCTYIGTLLATPAASPTRSDPPPMQVMTNTNPLLVDDNSSGSNEMHSIDSESVTNVDSGNASITPFTPPKQRHDYGMKRLYNNENMSATQSTNRQQVKTEDNPPLPTIVTSLKSMKRLIPPALRKFPSSNSKASIRDVSSKQLCCNKEQYQNECGTRNIHISPAPMETISTFKKHTSLKADDTKSSHNFHQANPRDREEKHPGTKRHICKPYDSEVLSKTADATETALPPVQSPATTCLNIEQIHHETNRECAQKVSQLTNNSNATVEHQGQDQSDQMQLLQLIEHLIISVEAQAQNPMEQLLQLLDEIIS